MNFITWKIICEFDHTCNLAEGSVSIYNEKEKSNTSLDTMCKCVNFSTSYKMYLLKSNLYFIY